MYFAKPSSTGRESPISPRQGSERLANDGYTQIYQGRATIDYVANLIYCQTFFWYSTLAESAVIVANTCPSLPISKLILENLLFGGEGSQIRFTTAAAVGTALGIAGGALRAWCYRELGKYFTFEVTIMKDHRLVTTGPYRIVRHPSYIGGIMVISGAFLLHATKGSWVRESGLLRYLPGRIATGIFAFIMAVGLPIPALLRMRGEDRELRKRFGDEWDAWAAKVRYMMIPGIL